MECYINGRCYTFNEEDLEGIKLDEGTEGCCYRVHNYRDDFVMKIHHDKPEKKILDEDTCKVLKDIETERFILPEDIIYDEDGNYLGYTLPYVDYRRPKIRNLKIRNVIDEFYILEKDVDILTDNYVLIDDLRIFNTIFSNGIYVCDPGSYTLAQTDEEKRFISGYNIERINEYELEEIIFNILKFSQTEKKGLRKFLDESDGYLSDFMRCFCYDKEENAKEFFKELSYKQG